MSLMESNSGAAKCLADGLLIAAVHVDRDRPDRCLAIAELIEEVLQRGGVATGLGPHDRLVERGILCSVTSGSMAGRFGGTVRDYTLCLFERGLVHNVASDSHGALNRPPDLLTGFENLEEGLPGIRAQAGWYTENVPAAVLAGTNIPGPPPGLIRRRKRRSNFGGAFRWNTRN
jgi:hypothetical protein